MLASVYRLLKESAAFVGQVSWWVTRAPNSPRPPSPGVQTLKVTRLTFQVGCPNSGDSWGRGLSKAAEGCLFARGLIGGAILLFVSVIKHPHGLQGELFPAAEAHGQHYRMQHTLPPLCTSQLSKEAHTPHPSPCLLPMDSPSSATFLPREMVWRGGPGCHTDPHIVLDPLRVWHQGRQEGGLGCVWLRSEFH